jgi:hypothetical protein
MNKTVAVTVRYMAILIGVYLVTVRATGAGRLIDKTASGVTKVGTGFTKALQGR